MNAATKRRTLTLKLGPEVFFNLDIVRPHLKALADEGTPLPEAFADLFAVSIVEDETTICTLVEWA